jgi:hypothetical protein
MFLARRLGNAFGFVFLTGIATATACGDDPEDNDGDDGGAGESRGGNAGAGEGGTRTGGTNAGGAAGDAEGGTSTGGRGGTRTGGTGGDAGGGGDAGDGGQGADSGEGGTAGSSAGMGGGGMGGANGGMAGGGMAGGGMAGGGMAGGGMAGGGMAGGGMAGGGMAGSGGMVQVGCGTATIIDDMEDGNGGICPSNNRVGGWYVGKEANIGTIIPGVGAVVNPALLVPARGTSTRGMHFQGSGFSGANHWAYLATSVFNGAEGVPYDASGATGIRFWAKSDGGAVTLSVKFNTVATSNTSVGGTCVPTTVPCDDHWQVPRSITGAWTQYSVHFGTELSQAGWGVAAPKDLAHLRAIEFYFSSTSTVSSFDFWIDDVEFW